MSISIVNDNLNTGNLNQAVASNPRIPVPISSATYDLHTLKLADSNMYYNVNAATVAVTLTLPANYATYRGRVLHFVNGANFIVSIAATISGTNGSVIGLDGASLNNATLLAATAGKWASLVCDGSSGWYVFASG
jgi:hypothetical protein